MRRLLDVACMKGVGTGTSIDRNTRTAEPNEKLDPTAAALPNRSYTPNLVWHANLESCELPMNNSCN